MDKIRKKMTDQLIESVYMRYGPPFRPNPSHPQIQSKKDRAHLEYINNRRFRAIVDDVVNETMAAIRHQMEKNSDVIT